MNPPVIKGLKYYSSFIDKATEDYLHTSILKGVWLHSLQRRVQHYGYRYDYKKRNLTENSYLGKLPEWCGELLAQISNIPKISITPDQLIVNEYTPGQGIAPHCDAPTCFSGTIIILSLISGISMEMISTDPKIKHEIYLEPRSLLILQDRARYEWKHGIRKRKNDQISGVRTPRGYRLSMTFREIIKP